MNVFLVDFVKFLKLIDFRLQLCDPVLQHLYVHSGSMFCSPFLLPIDNVFLLAMIRFLRVFVTVAPVPPLYHRGIDIELMG